MKKSLSWKINELLEDSICNTDEIITELTRYISAKHKDYKKWYLVQGLLLTVNALLVNIKQATEYKKGKK